MSSKIYFKIISATNRNEAASIRSAWYIEDYNGTDSNLESMAKHLDEMRANGINEILVSAIENGTSTYDNSEYFKTSSNVKKNNYGEYGNDFLKAITALAHERGMQVQAMIVPLTNGLENCFTELKDCKALSITGADSVATSQGAVRMLDPSNPLVQEKIQLTIDDILKCNPELDGVHLDYIRFGADNNSVNTVMGVTESARVGFNNYCNKYGLSYSFATLSSLKTSLSGNSSIFAKFNEYQQTLITDTVRNIKNVCREYDVPLTCAIADDYQYVKTWKCQDWAQWAQEGIVDGLYLMDYYMGAYWINYYFEDMLKATKNKVMLVTGIDPSYANLTAEYYPKTIKGALSNINSHGYGLFGTHTQAAKKDAWKLIDDSNWVDSVSAFDKLSVTMAKSSELLLKRCDLIYIESKNQTQQQKEALQADLEALNALITGEDVQSCDAVIAKLEEMSNKTYASNEASNRIVEQFNYMKKIVTTKKSILS